MNLEQINQLEEDMIKASNKDAIIFALGAAAFFLVAGLLIYFIK